MADGAFSVSNHDWISLPLYFSYLYYKHRSRSLNPVDSYATNEPHAIQTTDPFFPIFVRVAGKFMYYLIILYRKCTNNFSIQYLHSYFVITSIQQCYIGAGINTISQFILLQTISLTFSSTPSWFSKRAPSLEVIHKKIFNHTNVLRMYVNLLSHIFQLSSSHLKGKLTSAKKDGDLVQEKKAAFDALDMVSLMLWVDVQCTCGLLT